MSDLLDSVRALNPVPTCEQPSLEDVWCKLEGVHTSAVALDRSGDRDPAADVVAGRHVDGRRVWSPVRSRRVAVAIAVAVVVLIAGRQAGLLGKASARSAGSSAVVRRLAEGTISCDFAPVDEAHRPEVDVIPTRGRSAITYCRDRYRAATPKTANISQVAFIVCQTSATNVAVYIADGRPDQCHRLGDRALPAGYGAAVRQAGAASGTVSLSGRAAAVSV